MSRNRSDEEVSLESWVSCDCAWLLVRPVWWRWQEPGQWRHSHVERWSLWERRHGRVEPSPPSKSPRTWFAGPTRRWTWPDVGTLCQVYVKWWLVWVMTRRMRTSDVPVQSSTRCVTLPSTSTPKCAHSTGMHATSIYIDRFSGTGTAIDPVCVCVCVCVC